MSDLKEMLFDSIKLASDASSAAYREGQQEGYRRGFKAGIAEAQRIISETLNPRPQQATPASIQDHPKSLLVDNLP